MNRPSCGGWLGVIAVAIVGCGPTNFLLTVPDTTGVTTGPWVCRVENEKTECRQVQPNDPAALNPSGTMRLDLPRECKGRINTILVKNANGSHPELVVICAPYEPPVK